MMSRYVQVFSVVAFLCTSSVFAQVNMYEEVQKECKSRIIKEFRPDATNDPYYNKIFKKLVHARLGDGYISCHELLDAMIKKGLQERNNSANFYEILLDSVISLQSYDWTYPAYVVEIKPEWANTVFTENDALLDKKEEIELGDTFLHILLREQGGSKHGLYDVRVLSSLLMSAASKEINCKKNDKGKTPLDEFLVYKDKHMIKIAGEMYLADEAQNIIDLFEKACASKK